MYAVPKIVDILGHWGNLRTIRKPEKKETKIVFKISQQCHENACKKSLANLKNQLKIYQGTKYFLKTYMTPPDSNITLILVS